MIRRTKKMENLFGMFITGMSVFVLAIAATDLAGAKQLITNGGFESGFTGWTRVDQVGSEGTFLLQSGTLSPVNAEIVPTPTGGTNAAMTDAEGPGSHLLYQNFVVPTSFDKVVITYDLFMGNRAEDYFTPSPASLDFSTPALNQQARVDILQDGAELFSVSLSDIILSLLQTNPGDPLISGYTTHSSDLTSVLTPHSGQTLQLRFAETDNVAPFQLGVDNVSIESNPVPEPNTLLLFVSSLTVFMMLGRRFNHRK